MGGVTKGRKWSSREFQAKRKSILEDMRSVYYWHVHRFGKGAREPHWRGVRIVKYPTDLLLYAEAIFANKPDFIVETGTRYGGSALFLADILTITDAPGRVITIDPSPQWSAEHPKVEYIKGESNDPKVVSLVKEKVGSGSVMVTLDGDHRPQCVYDELNNYKDITTIGQYMVAEDCFTHYEKPYGPGIAVDKFMKVNDQYILEHPEDRYLLAVTRGGWLKRVR